MDRISLVVGGLLVIGGWLLGRVRSRSVDDSLKVDPDACGCGHPLAFHDRAARTCAAEVRRDYYNSYGEHSGHTWVKCLCRRYTGTRPVEELVHQQFMDEFQDERERERMNEVEESYAINTLEVARWWQPHKLMLEAFRTAR